jgi:1-deoxy-D-xylulose-5-phosphate synthase
MIVILNDNDMSISPNVGALSSFFSRRLTSDFFVRMKRETEHLLDSIPKIGKDLRRLAKKIEESIKGFITPGILFEAFGFDYVGPVDGHNLEELVTMLDNASRMDGPILVHVVTQKGKGYGPAQENPSLFHGVGPFDRKTGIVSKVSGPPSYTSIFGDTLVRMAEQDKRVVAISAAMLEGTGLKSFAEKFPERFFDVGIAEQHAVTFAAGLAVQGLKPVCAIYSTFMQRAYDNILHDVCLQKLPVTFALDRGGLVGADGPTHHGVFDYSFLRHIPNLVFCSPRNEIDLQRAMATAAAYDGPFAYRYPRGTGQGLKLSDDPKPFEIGKGELLRDGKDVAIFAIGTSVQESLDAAESLSKEGVDVAVIDVRFIKPLDEALILEYAQKTSRILTVEENVVQGGFGSAILELLTAHGLQVSAEQIGLPDEFVEQGTQAELRQRYGIDAAGIKARLQNLCLAKKTA